MTFRDTSAFTTLDNANMGTREDFRKWWNEQPQSIRTDESFEWKSEYGWNARQPEIDALKAENERLRKDAERYRWIRYRTSGDRADDTGAWVFNFPTLAYSDINPCNTAADNLDYTIDAAMKDFSTQPKEE